MKLFILGICLLIIFLLLGLYQVRCGIDEMIVEEVRIQ